MKRNFEIANFVFTVGSTPRLVMKDLFNEVIRPAFTDERLVRAYDKTSYLLMDVSEGLLQMGGATVDVLYGQIVKDTILERKQVRRGRELVPAEGAMESAPSSVFCLVKENHRLMFMPRHRGAPRIEEFEHTLGKFVRDKYEQYIHFVITMEKIRKVGLSNKEKAASMLVEAMGDPVIKHAMDHGYAHLFELLDRCNFEEGEYTPPEGRLTKKELRSKVLVRPNLHVSPLPTGESISDFLDRFSEIKSFKINVFPTNSEPDDSPFLEALRRRGGGIGATEMSVTGQAKGRDAGLNREGVKGVIDEASALGVGDLSVEGLSPSGGKIKGSQQNIDCRRPLEVNDSASTNEIAQAMLDATDAMVQDGSVSFPKVTEY